MKKANLAVIAAAVVAVCVAAVAGVLVFRANNGPAIEPDSTADTTEYLYAPVESTTEPSTLQAILDLTTQVITDTYEPSTQKATEKNTQASSTTQKPTQPATETTTKAPEEPTTQKGELDPDEMEHSSGTKRPVTASKNLPKDMSLSGLYSSGYDVIGLKPYIFNDDKDPNCMQRNFGYNPGYDMGASLIDFTIETTRIDFKYENKPYRIQLWKGQYISGDIGTVGGEIGVYTRTPGRIYVIPEHYDCAAEEDWLKMEMTVFWNEFDDGRYLPQFTRNYDDFWWATGFVDGQLKNRFDSNDLQLLGRITFESNEQAQLFANALGKKGFTEVSTFNPTVADTYKIYGKDVIFIWQNIR